MRLPSLPVGKRTVDRRTLPTVKLTDPAVTAALDAAIARTAGRGRCRITLATARLVSLRCTEPNDHSGGALTDVDSTLFAVDAATGTVARVPLTDMLVASPRRLDLPLPVLLGAPDETLGAPLTVTAAGLVVEDPMNDEPRVLGWREVAPHVRADSPLGQLLTAHGLTCAPAGAVPAPPPPVVPAIAGDAWQLVDLAAGLPPDLRAAVTLGPFVDGGTARLRFPAATPADVVAAASSSSPPTARLRVVRAYATPTATTFGPAVTRAAVELRGEKGTRGPVRHTVPAGALVTVALGTFDGDPSTLGRGWVFLSAGAGVHGWTRGRDLAPAPPPAP